MDNRYFIIGYQRSGTTLIHLLLKDHPQVSALNDELRVSPFFSNGMSCFTHGNDLPEEKKLGYVRMYDTLTTLMAGDDTLANGAKCVCNSKANAQILVDVISKHFKHMKIVHCIRNDLVAQFGSMMSSSRSGIMHSWYKGFKDLQLRPVRVNRLLFTRYVLGCLDTHAEIGKLKKTNPYYLCVYEEYLKDPDRVARELFNFIEVPDLKPEWLTSKKVLPAPEKYIHKYQENYALMEQIKSQYENNALSTATVFMSKVFAKIYHKFNIGNRIRTKKRQKQKELRRLRR